MTVVSKAQISLATAAAVLLASGAAPAAADVADFYKGKQINIVVGYSPGGGYDTYTRLLATVIGNHIPGNPEVIVTNMPGGGSLKAANYTYNVAPKDGTHLGVFSAPVAVEPLLGRKNAKFEALKFGWLGNMFRDTHGCVAWHKSSLKSLQDVIDAKEPVVFGATSASSYGNQHARVLQAMVGANIKIVTGYRGIKGVGKALQGGEVTAACAMSTSTLKSSFRELKESGQFRMIVQFGREKLPFMDNATHFYSLLKSDDDKRVADFFFSQSAIARPVAAPPGIPADRLAALSKAFADSLADPALLATAKRIGIDVTYETPEMVRAAFTELYATPPAIVARVKKIMGRK
tara:strand:+ start:1234 stop:2277 length:1044 start_codon:yes stop_codon:yes gene_type:complete